MEPGKSWVRDRDRSSGRNKHDRTPERSGGFRLYSWWGQPRRHREHLLLPGLPRGGLRQVPDRDLGATAAKESRGGIFRIDLHRSSVRQLANRRPGPKKLALQRLSAKY